jgi:hypothetical protein
MNVQALTKQISALAQKGADDIQEADRAALLGSLYKLRDAVENPFEKIVRIMFDVTALITFFSLFPSFFL